MKQSLTSSGIPLAAVSVSSASYSFRALRASERLQSVFPPYNAVVIFYDNTLASISVNRSCTFKKEEPEINSLPRYFFSESGQWFKSTALESVGTTKLIQNVQSAHPVMS